MCLALLFRLSDNGTKRHLLPINCTKFQLFYYSTAPANVTNSSNLLVDLLVNSVGFSKEKAISTSTKVTCLKPGNNKPNLVLSFFKQIGLHKTQIKTLVSAYPGLLFSDVDNTLKPKITVLQKVGLSGSNLTRVITRSGALFHTSLDTCIRNLDYLRELLGSDVDSVAVVIKRAPWLFSRNLPKVMPPNIVLLERVGFSSMDINKFFLNRPLGMVQKTEWLESVVRRVEKDFGIPRGSPMFKHGLEAIVNFGESTLKMKLEIFRSFGWSDSDILTMVQKLPYCLTASEAKLRNGLKFFMNELGYKSSYIASHPTLLKLSLEKRVLPRNEIFKLLKEKRLLRRRLCLYTVVSYPESKFIENCVLPFRYELPELYELYMKSKG
ncbi:transcription termination factor MTEF18, mitochondrial-like [Nicotiana tabacum]|uniref:Transcription termination factor MTEF18, mitochondrial-like n=1 Tax=Nicotiana tabacum TaxID=4097 RepID=A0A1S4DJ88_TOBAC|nr:PREDICTED: uncharacterized protein LOC107830412 [Nicotiana tabacum]